MVELHARIVNEYHTAVLEIGNVGRPVTRVQFVVEAAGPPRRVFGPFELEFDRGVDRYVVDQAMDAQVAALAGRV